MPIYEYQCTACNHKFEERQGFDAEPICACPECHNEARRLFRPAPIIFKGSGFYVTDYNSKQPSANSNGDGSGNTESKSETTASTQTAEASKSATEQ